jgi:predicted nuclease with TOPRIM domain
MDHDETIQFLLDQQAKFFANLEEVRDEMQKLAARQSEIETAMSRLAGVIEKLTTFQERTVTSMDLLMKLVERYVEHTESRLGPADERLNALIQIVDGMVREKRTSE